MSDAITVIDGVEATKKLVKKQEEKQRPEMFASPEERAAKVKALNEEVESLIRYFKEGMTGQTHEGLESQLTSFLAGNVTVNALIALMLEEKNTSYSKLVSEIFERAKERDSAVTVASVKSSVLLIGQRVSYGAPNAEADVLEDETESCLWCWETRDMKLLPNFIRRHVKTRRTWRKKISERINALLVILSLLQKPQDSQSYRTDLRKASDKLSKALTEADIRLLANSLAQKNGSNIATKDAKREEKLLTKQQEKNKRDMEKEEKRKERELQKEKLQNEKEQKRLQEEAEKEEKRRERENEEMRKNLKRKQEEMEKDQRRREKEEAELKKQRTLKKQASIMERFFIKNKNTSNTESERPSTDATTSNLPDRNDTKPESVTLRMDYALLPKDEIDVEEIWKSHMNSWRLLGHSIRAGNTKHWGLRRKPKANLIKELKLGSNKEASHDEEWGTDSMTDRYGETVDVKASSQSCGSTHQNGGRKKQLLQFDKSHRPAFYGVWPKKSLIVGPRHPLRKDPELEYDIDSDEEWEEEEPGESLSDCEKDEEEIVEEGSFKADDEDESDDGFFVPDGYLSENEGVQIERNQCQVEEDGTTKVSSSSRLETDSDEHSSWLRQLKYVHSMTEHALRKTQPLFITNLMHEKSQLSSAEDLSGNSKIEFIFMQALAMHVFPGSLLVELPSDHSEIDNQEPALAKSKTNISVAETLPVILDSDLPRMVSVIQSCPHGISKVTEILQQEFPNIRKVHLRNKVREISDFMDNRWQVKKEILDKLGISTSPEKSGMRTKSIAAFFSKRCLPPSGRRVSPAETSPESTQKKEGSTVIHACPNLSSK